MATKKIRPKVRSAYLGKKTPVLNYIKGIGSRINFAAMGEEEIAAIYEKMDAKQRAQFFEDAPRLLADPSDE